MTTDNLVSEQTHQYFLQEAAELLQTMDEELETLRVDFTVQKVHNLMRAAHTLKGAAASVGLDTIKATTHSLEDVFKALCHQDAVISVEMEGLIFGAYECLQLLLSTQLAEAQVDETYIVDRMAGLMVQLQEMLGDRFGQGGQLPSSHELGFDMTQSIFEVGVTERLDELASAIAQPDSDELSALLESHAAVFIGLAESFDLPGFGDIALTTLAALEASPNTVLEIASVALNNYRQGQAAVLAGDRDQGGAPSPELLTFLEDTASFSIQPDRFQIDAPIEVCEDGFPQIDAPIEVCEDGFPKIDAPIEAVEDGFPQIDYEIIEGYPEIVLEDADLPDPLAQDASDEAYLVEEGMAWPLALVEPPPEGPLDSQRQQSFTDAYVELANARWPENLWNLLTRPIGGDREPMCSSAQVSRPVHNPKPSDFIQYTVDYPTIPHEDVIADGADSETLSAGPQDTLIQLSLPSEFVDDTLNEFNGEVVLFSAQSQADVLDFDRPDLDSPDLDSSDIDSPDTGSLDLDPAELNAIVWTDDTLVQQDIDVDLALEQRFPLEEIPTEEGALDTNAVQEQVAELSELAELTPAELESLTLFPEIESLDESASLVSESGNQVNESDNQVNESENQANDLVQAAAENNADISADDEIADFLNDIVSAPLPLPPLEVMLEPEKITSTAKPEPEPEPEAKAKATPKATVRMTVEHLDQLSQAMGELLTQQNQQALHIDQLSNLAKQLLSRTAQQQTLLNTYKETGQAVGRSKSVISYAPDRLRQSTSSFYDQFDALELDEYSDIQLLAQRLLSETVQQTEVAEAIDLFVRRSQQTIDKQKRLLANTRETLLEARMLPMDKVLQRFPSALARLERQHNKPARLVIEGGDVLVDKAIADKLFDPLLHLVRNAFDHGIESPDVRQQQHKSAVGTITLSARQQGRYLVIEVRDDGKGIDLAMVRQKAIENHLITAQAAASLTPIQTAELLFEPGFSTATTVDDLSGRGVGLDAVRAQVRSLQGLVTVSHEHGVGTCFTLQIPASLTIAKLLICEAKGQTYALVADAIEHILMPTADQLSAWEGGKTLTWQHNQQTHLIRVNALADALHYAAPMTHRSSTHVFTHTFTDQEETSSLPSSPILVLRHDGSLTGGSFIGLEVDQLLGEQELVITSLGDAIVPPDYIYGSSILPNGQLTLVLDGLTLAHSMMQNVRGYRQETTLGKIEISFAADAADPGSAALNLSDSMQRDASRGALILIVDDSITVRNTLAETLETAGYQVIQAKDGTEGLQQLQRYPTVSAIVCDIEMPGMNGFEFLKMKRGRAEVAAIPVIMLSSRGGAKHRFLTKELGAIAHLTKPYGAPELLKTVTEAIEQNAHTTISQRMPSIAGERHA